MEVLGIIAVRGGSKEIPLKNLVLLNKKPLLYYTVKSSLDSRLINRTVVSTDHLSIEKVAKKLRAEVIKRPRKLSGSLVEVEAAMLHALDFLKESEDYIPDIVVLLQNTVPLKSSKDIDDGINFFKKGRFDSVLSGFLSHQFFWKKNNKNVFPMNYNPQKRPNRQEIKDQFVENGAFYITKYSSFLKSKCRVSGKIGIYVMPKERSIDINTKFDLFLVEQIQKKS